MRRNLGEGLSNARTDFVSGPGGGGKSAEARRLLAAMAGAGILVDYQSIYAALTGVERSTLDGRYPDRVEALLPIVEYTRMAAIAGARDRELNIVATNANGDAQRRRELIQALGPGAVERILDPGRQVIEARLTDARGLLSDGCRDVVNRWYSRV